MANSGLEVEIYRDSAPFTKVGIIEARTSPTTMREIRAPGAGSFQVRKDNAKITSDPTLLDYRNFVRVRVNGVCQGGFIIKNKKHVIVGEGEKREEVWSISGEGFRSWAKDAEVVPDGGITAYSRETRYFNFASFQGSWYNPSQWVNATVTWGWNQSGNWYQTAPKDWPDAPTAKWIWDRGNGSYAIPQGYVYFRKEFSLAEAGQYALFFAVDDAAEVYMDGELIHTTAEHAWQETTREDVELSAGNHVLAFKAYNYKSDGPGSLISALYKIGNATSPTAAAQMFVSDSTWKVCGYPSVEPGWTIGNILTALMSEASARGVRFAQNWTRTFSATNDSAGVPWGTNISISFDIGTKYDDVFDALEEQGCDIYIDPETLEMHAYKERGVDRSIEGSTANPIVLRVGHNLKTADEAGQADIVNTLLLKTADGWSVSQPTDTTSITKYGRIEGQISTDLTRAQASSLVDEVFGKKSLPEKTATFELIPVPNMVPWENFMEGDWVSAPGEVPGVLEKRRVMSISVTEKDSNGDPIYAVEFDTIFGDRTDDLAKMLSRATHSSALGGGFSNTTGTPSTVTQGSSPALPVSSPPATPTGLVVSTVGRWADNGSAVSDYGLVWDAVISNTNNLPVTDIEVYEVWGRKNPDTVFALRETVFDSFAYLKNFNPGESWSWRVRARSRTGGYSEFSSIQTLTADAPVVPMGTPSPPTLISELGTVVIKWDGLIGGAPPPKRFKFMKVVRATSAGGTYTMVASFTEGTGTDSSGVVGTTYWYKLIPVDYLGVEGTPSAAASIAVAGVSTSELDAAVAAAISGAQTDAANAVTAANGKNKITFATVAPTTSNTGIAGDLWYRRDGTGQIIAIYENTGGTTWVQRTMTDGTLANLNAGVLTTGFLAADRIGANSITSEKVLIANLDNQLDNPNFETGTYDGWIRTGSTAGWSIPTSSTTDVNKYLQRVTTTASAAGQITNTFKVAVRPGQRMRIDGKSFHVGAVAATWTETRRNFFWDPYATALTYFTDPALGTYSLRTDMTGGTATAVRWTRTGGGSARIMGLRVGTTMPNGSTPLRLRLRVRASEAMTVDVFARPTLSSTTNQSAMATALAIPAGVSEVVVDGNSFNAATTSASGIAFSSSSGAVGATFDVTNVSIEPQATSIGFFAGNMTSGTDFRYSFVGTANASASIYEILDVYPKTGDTTIGMQFYDAAGAALTYLKRGVAASGTWQAFTFEQDVPNNAYFASLRIEDAGTASTTVRYANLQFRFMGAGQLLVDGIIQGRHVAANTIEGESMKIGTIAVDRLEPNAGASLDLAANGSINFLVGTTEAQAQAIAAQQAALDENAAQTSSAQATANAAAATANAASTTANGLQAGIEQTSSDLAALGTTYRFTPTGAFIGAPGSPYEFVIQSNGAEIRQNGVATTSWDSGRMIVASIVGQEVVMGNHKLEADDAGTGTVVRKI